MFGSSSSRGWDGIHYRGAEGSSRLTSSIVEGLTAAAPEPAQAGEWRVQGRQGAATTTTTPIYSQVVTSNMFQGLNC